MLRLSLYCLLFCLAQNTFVSAQVYNYFPFSYYDAETNPTITVSERYDKVLNIQHQNSFSSANPFSISRIGFTKNLERIFCGTALTVTNTNFRNKTYNQMALSFAYRNVLFNSVFVRLGVTGKLIQNDSPAYFDYFSTITSGDVIAKKISGNFNLNFSIATTMERYYLSFSALNLFPSAPIDSLAVFPKYYLMQAGNLLSLFKRTDNSEISFTFFVKENQNGSRLNAFTNIYYDLKLNRRSGLLIGGKIGMAQNSFYQFIPTLSWYTRNFLASFQYSFFQKLDDYPSLLVPTYQLNLNIKLWSRKKYLHAYF